MNFYEYYNCRKCVSKLEFYYFPVKRENVQDVGRFERSKNGIQMWKGSSSRKRIFEFSVSKNL